MPRREPPRPPSDPGGARTGEPDPDSADGWCSFFKSKAQHGNCERAVRADCLRRCMLVDIEEGWVVPRANARDTKYGLSNLGQLCAQASEGEWPELIKAHFDQVLSSEAAEREIEDGIGDFRLARKRLLIRLWDEEDSPVKG